MFQVGEALAGIEGLDARKTAAEWAVDFGMYGFRRNCARQRHAQDRTEYQKNDKEGQWQLEGENSGWYMVADGLGWSFRRRQMPRLAERV